MLACAMQGAVAESDVGYIGVAQALIYESNLYRVDESVALGTLSRSDMISNTSLVGGIDQPVGRQRLYGSVKLGHNRYRNNDYLNDSSYSASAGIDWSTLHRLSGSVNVASSSNQRSFNVDTGPGSVETRKNNERVTQLDASARIGVVTPLTVEAALGYRRVGYSAPEYEASQYRQSRGSLGVRYRPRIAIFGTSLSLGDTHYGQPAAPASAGTDADRLRRTSMDLTVSWPVSGHSQLYARLSPTRVTYRQFTQRNYSGVTGALKWDWLATGKLNVQTRLLHDIGQDSSFETFGGPLVFGTSRTSRVTTDLFVSAEYAMTAKVGFNAGWGRSHRSLEQAVSLNGATPLLVQGADDTDSLTLGARWTPLRNVQLGCSLTRARRTSVGGLTQGYRADTVACQGQFVL